jgi:hypothetical protein
MGEAKRKRDRGGYFGQAGYVAPEPTMPGLSRQSAELPEEPPHNVSDLLSAASILALVAIGHLSGRRRP